MNTQQPIGEILCPNSDNATQRNKEHDGTTQHEAYLNFSLIDIIG